MSDETNTQSASSSSPRIGDTRPAPQIGDTRPGSGPPSNAQAPARQGQGQGQGQGGGNRRRRGGRGRGQGGQGGQPRNPNRTFDSPVEASAPEAAGEESAAGRGKNKRRRGGGERRTRAQGRYLMCVHTSKEATHIATLEGRTMVEYTVAKAADETNQICLLYTSRCV